METRAAAIALLVSVATLGCTAVRSDQSMIKAFHIHRAVYSEIVRMAEDDKLDGSLWVDAPEKNQPDLSSKRRDEYEELFRKGGLFGINRNAGRSQITFFPHLGSFDAEHKCYKYSAAPIAPLYDALDKTTDFKPYEDYHRILDDHWYLVYTKLHD